MQDWWKSLTHKQKIALIVTIIAAIGGISIALNISISTGDTTTQTINIGLTLEEHEQRLKRREAEVRAELEQAHAADQHVLATELNAINQQLQDTQASYEAYIASFKERIAQLEQAAWRVS